ncbi:hypothetical protein SeLEV6574_g08601, partial [Synchytrium endobioticum]
TPGRNAAARDVPTSSSTLTTLTENEAILTRLENIYTGYFNPTRLMQEVDFYKNVHHDVLSLVVRDSAVLLKRIRNISFDEDPYMSYSLLCRIRDCINDLQGAAISLDGVGPLLPESTVTFLQAINNALDGESTKHLRETDARPKFIDFIGVGVEPEYPQSGPISSPTFHNFLGTESEHQRLPDADEAPTRSATALRDVHSRQSNPHGYSRHDSTHTGSGSTSGHPRYSDRSSHGAGPSRRGSRRDSSRGKELE